MPATLATIVDKFCRRQAMPVPSPIVGNNGADARQMLGLLEEFCEDLVTRKKWQVNVLEATWAALGTESQGTIASLCPTGYRGIVPGTVWNRTQQLRIAGGLQAKDWQYRKATNFVGPIPEFRLRGGLFLLSPAPTAGHTYALEYYSSWFVRSSSNVPQQYWLADDNTCIFDDSLPISYLRWAWKKEKGLDYSEEFAKYEALVGNEASYDQAPRAIDVSCSAAPLVGPGIIVPSGSWNLP